MTAGHDHDGGGGEPSAVDVAIALMLFGSITFHVSLFYLVNHSDRDIRRYTWETLGSVIGIFCSLLIFRSLDGLIDRSVDAVGVLGLTVVSEFVTALGWWALLQAVLFWKAGAHTQLSVSSDHHVRTKAAAILLGHIAAFASINAWGEIQQLSCFTANPHRAVSVVGCFYVLTMLLTYVTGRFREWKVNQDGVLSETEKLWNHEVEEAEDEAMGITGSFLIVQAVRFTLSGSMPDKGGHMHGHTATANEFLGLIYSAFCALPLAALLGRLCSHNASHKTTLDRLIARIHTAVSMFFAWCLFFAISGEVERLSGGGSSGLVLALGIALVVSLIAFAIIFVLDKLADTDTKGYYSKPIIDIILSLAMMVGFAWEHCFLAGNNVITKGFLAAGVHRQIGQVFLAAGVASFIIPAWRTHILGASEHASTRRRSLVSEHPKEH